MIERQSDSDTTSALWWLGCEINIGIKIGYVKSMFETTAYKFLELKKNQNSIRVARACFKVSDDFCRRVRGNIVVEVCNTCVIYLYLDATFSSSLPSSGHKDHRTTMSSKHVTADDIAAIVVNTWGVTSLPRRRGVAPKWRRTWDQLGSDWSSTIVLGEATESIRGRISITTALLYSSKCPHHSLWWPTFCSLCVLLVSSSCRLNWRTNRHNNRKINGVTCKNVRP